MLEKRLNAVFALQAELSKKVRLCAPPMAQIKMPAVFKG